MLDDAANTGTAWGQSRGEHGQFRKPVTNEDPQNPRLTSLSTVYINSRKSKVGHSGLRDIQGSLNSILPGARAPLFAFRHLRPR